MSNNPTTTTTKHDDPTSRPAPQMPPAPSRAHADTVGLLNLLAKGVNAHRTGDEGAKQEVRKLYAEMEARIPHGEEIGKAIDYVRLHLIGGQYVPGPKD